MAALHVIESRMDHTTYMRGWRKRKTDAMSADEREAQRQAQRAYMRAWKKRNPDKVKATAKKRASTPKMKAYQRAWQAAWRRAQGKPVGYKGRYKGRATNGHHKNVQQRARNVGLPVEDFISRLERALETCEICKAKCANLQADHDHATGRFRGFLCVGCNTFLGALEKRMHLLGAVASYLEGSK
jgi:hypothetical protein